MTKITAPGVYDLTADEYHADPVAGGSLSSGEARLLLSDCPAMLKWRKANPPAPKKEFDLGHVAHRLVLGKGAKYAVLDYANRKTNAYKADEASARESGLTPILKADFKAAQAMAQAVTDHPFAGDLFRNGAAERALIWRDPETGIMCRALFDYLHTAPIINPDFKTAVGVTDAELERAIASHGYHVQAAHYLDGIRALGLAKAPSWVFVFALKTPPHFVRCVALDGDSLEIGRLEAARARRIYAECKAADRWPAYDADADTVATLGLPGWIHQQHKRRVEDGYYDQSPLEGTAA